MLQSTTLLAGEQNFFPQWIITIMSLTPHFTLNFTLTDWFYRGDDYFDPQTAVVGSDKAYDLSDIPAMQRRRLPEVAKRIHRFAQGLADEQTPMIYASHNGEISQTLSIIRSFSSDVSPAKFSLSVHNAIAGLLSVTHKNCQSYQAIDSLSGLIETAVVEAVGLLAQHDTVGIVYHDETLPTELMTTDDKPPTTQVLGLKLQRGQTYQLQKIPAVKQQSPENMTAEFANIRAIADFLRGEQNSLDNHYANTTWQWSRDVG